MATNIQTLIEEFKQGKHNELLKDIYVDEAVIYRELLHQSIRNPFARFMEKKK